MRLQPRVLLVILFAFLLRSSAGAQQPPHMVILFPRAVASDPTLPAVRITVDHQRVQLGTLVNFTMSPASLASDKRYIVRLNFGDGQQRVMNQPETEHLYGSVGKYIYSVSIARKPPEVNLNVSGVPARENEVVRFTAQLSLPYPDLQYRFVYGDGSRTDWQRSPSAEHAYNRAGDYSAYVDVGDGKQGLGGSARKQITISSNQPVQVSLTAAPSPARKGQSVVFNAKVSGAIANAKYQFNFGDGTATLWQVNPQAQHIYNISGTRNAFVQLSQSGNNPNAVKSNILAVSVQPIQAPPPGPGSGPNTYPTPTPDASASATPSPSTSPTPSPSASTVDSPSPGSGSVSATTPSTTGLDGNNPNVAPGSIRWWYWLLAGLLLLLLFKATAYLFAAKPMFAAVSDPGVAGITNKKGLLPLDFQLVLNPNVSKGDYSIATKEPQLITNLDRLQERQVLEI